MNKLRRRAAVVAVCAGLVGPGVLLAPPALAEPRPWHEGHNAAQNEGPAKTKAQIEHEEMLQQRDQQASVTREESMVASTDDATVPWDAIGLAALGTAVVAVGGAAVARRYRQVGTTV